MCVLTALSRVSKRMQLDTIVRHLSEVLHVGLVDLPFASLNFGKRKKGNLWDVIMSRAVEFITVTSLRSRVWSPP